MGHRSHMTKSMAGLAVTVALLGAACGKSSPSTAPPTTPGATTSSPAATTPPPASPSLSPGVLTVQQGAGGALVFAPATFSVKEGSEITVSNVGLVAHTFTVVGKNIDVVNQPGQPQNVKIDLSPGTYQFICRFHVSFGMKGTMTVTD